MVLLDLSKTSCHSIWEVSRADGNKVFYGRIIETDRDQISSVEGIFIKSENASPSYYLKEGRAIDKLGNKETGKWSYSRESGINFLCKGKRETKNDVQIGVFEPNVTLGSSILVAGTRKTKQTKIEEGTFVYSKETNAVELNEGSRYYTNSSARVDGIFKYSSELKQHLLVNGRVCLSNGAFKKGIFEYDSTKERIRFKEGTYYDKNGNKYHGKFTYNSFLKTDILNDGIHCFEKGVVSRNGTFEFDHENHKLLLIDGRILLSTGQAFFFKDGQIVL
ncbi:hypothetical protein HOG98_08650 [bacterium]|nr:hypothetical protein [bacterium]